MGVYDSVLVPCPRCGHEEWFQTKSGVCELHAYPLADAPSDALEDVNRHSPHQCEKCSAYFAVNRETRKAVETKAWDWADYGVGTYESMPSGPADSAKDSPDV